VAFVHGWKDRALRLLTPLAAELVVARLECPAADVITYIPPDGDRSLRRGHHPPARLARELGRRWEVPVRPLGHVTSSYHSAALGRSIALALVAGGRARMGETLYVPLEDGAAIPVQVASAVFYDPKGARLNA